jgi:predicted phage tail protein
MTLIKLHGKLGESTGRKEWKLKVSSVAEAFHAINCQSEDGLKKFFLKEENAYATYDVLINNKKSVSSKDPENNELTIDRDDLERIDVIPALEGAGLEWLGIFLGGMGIFTATTPMAMMTSIMLMAQGISSLLSKPPPMPEQRQITNPSSDPTALANSYLFNGPVNVINEGGPVPLGYGRLIVGSQVIMSSYGVKRLLIRDAGRVR